GVFQAGALGWHIGRREAACFAIGIGHGLDECDFARVFAMHVQPAIGVADCSRTDAALLPLDLTGCKISAEQAPAVSAVEITVDFHRAADRSGKLIVEIDLSRFDASPTGLELHQSAAAFGRAID